MAKDATKLTPTGEYVCRTRGARARRDRRGIELYLPQELITWAEEEALRRGLNRSEVIEQCIRHYSGKTQGG